LSITGNSDPAVSVGIDYSKRFAAHWSFDSGFEQTISTSHAGGAAEYEFHVMIISIPVQLKYNLNKHLYFRFGPSLDIYNPDSDFESRLGGRLGIG
jgi:hypothetical protein